MVTARNLKVDPTGKNIHRQAHAGDSAWTIT